MTLKQKKKTRTKKKTAKKPARKSKTVKKKTAVRKKKGKKTAKKTLRKKTAKTTKKTASRAPRIPKKDIVVEPGPPSLIVPSVEEPSSVEEAVGTVTHYYSHLGVAIVQINKGTTRTGDKIHFKGHTTDFNQQIESMEYDHHHVDQASAGQSVGIKVNEPVREHDIVFLIRI